MVVKVFIQNEAGSDQKQHHDEKTLEWRRAVTVSRAYPFPYGFIVGTTADDGCNVDCFVLTTQPLRTGDVVDCEVVGLMEQFEDGHTDHNVLVTVTGEPMTVTTAIQTTLTDFVQHVFDHIEGKQIRVGRFLGSEPAMVHVAVHSDSVDA